MSKKLHWFPFYYLDWLSDSEVVMMTYSEKGLFIDMLSRCFNEGGLPADEKKLVRLFRCEAEDLKECVKMFYEKDEKLFNKKLDSIQKDQRKVSAGRSKAGKVSAQKRKDKRLTESTNVEQVLKSVATKAQQNSTNTTEHNTTEQSIKTKPKKFTPPSFEEAEEYKKSKNLFSIDSQYFINHYEGNGWKIGKNSMKSWTATMSNWHSRHLKDNPTTDKKDINPF